MSLKDKVCIVTGGNSGIERAVTLKFAAAVQNAVKSVLEKQAAWTSW